MKCIFRITYLYVLFFLLIGCDNKDTSGNIMKLWYDEPADSFINALPLGNGRLAIMAYGNPENEIIHLNEETLWSGGPANLNSNSNSPKYLNMVRTALSKEDYALADDLSRKMQGLFSESYMPVGDLLINQKINGNINNYVRELNLETAIHKTSFSVDGIDYTREYFVSYPDQSVIIHFTSSKRNLNMSFGLKSQLKPIILLDKEGDLLMNGRAPSHVEPDYITISDTPIQWENDTCGMRFQVRLRPIENDGKISIKNDCLNISDASNITMAVSIATSFNGYDKNPVTEGKNENVLAQKYLDDLKGKDYVTLKENHTEDYSKYFNATKLYLKGNLEAEKVTTDKRLINYQQNNGDYGLESLLFNYGRYLLISSSRKGGLPANLQGKWNIDLRPAWSCNYTMNINLQMNYWASEKVGLSDMVPPLVEHIKNLAVTGRGTAKNFYDLPGIASGHNSDIWAMTNPVGNLGMGKPQWANWCMAFPWLCMHLWDRYQYTGDEYFLQEIAYPIMKESSLFCEKWLVENKEGYLVPCPSTSPENCFLDNNGDKWSVSEGSYNEIALIRNLFENTILATTILDVDKDFSVELESKLKRMLPYKIGIDGYLQEWAQDFKEADKRHRHISHLVALHPGNDISLWKSPDLFDACKKTLERRGDEGNGWARAWKICFWARLLDGEHAYNLLRNTLELAIEPEIKRKPGTYFNLLNACPPFQIDGNLGIVEGISEMLLQSHLNEIYLLPALPSAWDEGKINGIKARGGYTCSIEWKHSKLKEAIIKAENDTICNLRTNLPVVIDNVENVNEKKDTVKGYTTYRYSFRTKKDEVYVVRCK